MDLQETEARLLKLIEVSQHESEEDFKIWKVREVDFWQRVKIQPNGCWLWDGAINSGCGVGKVSYRDENRKRHTLNVSRWVYERYCGTLPTTVGTSCLNKLCVNPNHLLPVKFAGKGGTQLLLDQKPVVDPQTLARLQLLIEISQESEENIQKWSISEIDFWRRVVTNASGCWLWTGSHRLCPESPEHEYGFISQRNEKGNKLQWRCHRWVFERYVDVLPDELDVMHTCDIAKCVRPSHLRKGTHKDNMDDMVSKGRHSHGSKHGNTDLTEEIVQKVKGLVAAGVDRAEIAQQLGVTANAVDDMVRGRSWLNVDTGILFKKGNKHLLPSKVDEMKELIKTDNYTYTELARMFGCSITTVSNIARGKIWNGKSTEEKNAREIEAKIRAGEIKEFQLPTEQTP